MSKRAYNNRRDNVFPSTGTRNNTNDHNVNSTTSDRNRNNDSFNERSNHTSRHCDRSTSRSRSNHHDRPAQSQYIHNNFSLQFDCRNHDSHPTDRTPNNINRGGERTDESHQQVEQQHSNSYNDYQHCTSRDNSNRRNPNDNDGYPGNCNSIPGTPHGNRLGHESTTMVQNGTPHGNSQSGSEPNGNSLVLPGTADANSLSNGTPMLADTTTTICSRMT